MPRFRFSRGGARYVFEGETLCAAILAFVSDDVLPASVTVRHYCGGTTISILRPNNRSYQYDVVNSAIKGV